MRLLIAEDELDLAEALTVFFEKNHFSVDAVHNLSLIHIWMLVPFLCLRVNAARPFYKRG